jgi:hypothetical protein
MSEKPQLQASAQKFLKLHYRWSENGAHLNLLTNFFIASTRLVSKQRNPVTGKTRKKYDKARTPYERVMEQMKDGAGKRNLVAMRESLDPIELQENIQKSLKRLFNHMKPESIL